MRPFVFIFLGLLGLSVIAWAIRPPASTDGRITLVWVSDDAYTRRLTIEEFDHEHPRLDLQLDPDDTASAMQKIIVQSLAGVGPDLFDCYSPNQLAAFVRAGIAWDVTDELAKAGINVQTQTWPVDLGHVMVAGRVYGVPANASSDALWFNKGILDSQRIAYPDSKTLNSWSELVALAQRLTQRDSSGQIVRYGLAVDDAEWETILRIFGGKIFSDDGTRCTLDSPQAIQAVRMIHDLIYVYHVTASPAEQDAAAQVGGWGSYGMKLMMARHAAMAIGGPWWALTFRTDPSMRLGVCLLPLQPHGQYMGVAKSTLINRKSPRRQQALQLLIFMAGPQYNRIINQEADAMGGFVKFATDENLLNPKYPWEDFHPIFRQLLNQARPQERDAFVDSSSVDRVITTQLDLVRRDAKPADEAMRSATAQIDQLIQVALRRDPALRKQYDHLVAISHEEAQQPQ